MSEALVYAAVENLAAPAGGVWMVHKHCPSGELVGPSVPFGVPTIVVYAEATVHGWAEIPNDEAKARIRRALTP